MASSYWFASFADLFSSSCLECFWTALSVLICSGLVSGLEVVSFAALQTATIGYSSCGTSSREAWELSQEVASSSLWSWLRWLGTKALSPWVNHWAHLSRSGEFLLGSPESLTRPLTASLRHSCPTQLASVATKVFQGLPLCRGSHQGACRSF